MEFRAELFPDPDQRKEFIRARQELDSFHERVLLLPPSLPATTLGHLAAILESRRYGLLLRPDWPLPWRHQLEQRLRSIPEADLRALAPHGGLFIATGGSSGEPRFALHSPQSLIAAATSVLAYATGARPMHVAITLPVDHVSGLMPFLRAQLSEGSVLLSPWRDVAKIAAGRWLSLVPTQLSELVKQGDHPRSFAEAEGIFMGGASLDDLPLDQPGCASWPIHFTYGMTETAGMIAARRWDGTLPVSPAAPLLHGVDVSIAADTGRIAIDYPGLAPALWPELTPVPRPYPTDDHGAWESPGVLRIKGRMDRVIVSGGEKIDPSRVEASLRNLPGVKAARVVGVRHPLWGESVSALCHAPEMTPADWSTRDATLRANLPRAWIPRTVYLLDEPPLDERGKWSIAVAKLKGRQWTHP